MSEKQNDKCNPRIARICRDCDNLVTTDSTCPLCDVPTEPHPGASEKESYCVRCGKGPFPLEGLHLLTWNEDPYTQTEDGDMSCLCETCRIEQGDDE